MDHAESAIKLKNKTKILEMPKRVGRYPTEIQWKLDAPAP